MLDGGAEVVGVGLVVVALVDLDAMPQDLARHPLRRCRVAQVGGQPGTYPPQGRTLDAGPRRDGLEALQRLGAVLAGRPGRSAAARRDQPRDLATIREARGVAPMRFPVREDRPEPGAIGTTSSDDVVLSRQSGAIGRGSDRTRNRRPRHEGGIPPSSANRHRRRSRPAPGDASLSIAPIRPAPSRRPWASRSRMARVSSRDRCRLPCNFPMRIHDASPRMLNGLTLSLPVATATLQATLPIATGS